MLRVRQFGDYSISADRAVQVQRQLAANDSDRRVAEMERVRDRLPADIGLIGSDQ
jgi:hypothetical protein